MSVLSEQTECTSTAGRAICECARCRGYIAFKMDDHLIAEIEEENCVLFIGAGVSTENRNVFPHTFYDDIRYALEREDLPAFPDLMSDYCAQPNGREKLVRKLVNRFDYIDSFSELRLEATAFHRELATMPYFSELVTTNWDRYIEEFAGAKPYVYESDVPFWGMSERSVLKIHGTIDNYSSVIATREDYKACESSLERGLIGNQLKEFLAKKTCIFVGYSLRDDDFISILKLVKEYAGMFSKTHYVVSPMFSPEDHDRFNGMGIVPIRTDGTFFLTTVKKHMCEAGCFAADDTYIDVEEALDIAVSQHTWSTNNLSPFEDPHHLGLFSYQDGIIHALKRIIDARKKGRYSDLHKLQGSIQAYDEKSDLYASEDNYWDAYYFRGYLNGLLFFLFANQADGVVQEAVEEHDDVYPGGIIPMFYGHDAGEMFSRQEYTDKCVGNNLEVDAKATFFRTLERYERNDDIVFQHTPFG